MQNSKMSANCTDNHHKRCALYFVRGKYICACKCHTAELNRPVKL